MVISFVTALTLMLAFIFGSPNVKRYKRDGLSFEESRFYCLHCTYCYISAKLHPIFLRDGVINDWTIFEIKRVIPLTRSYRDVPVIAREITYATQQVRNYSRILRQDTVKRRFATQGIEYFEPALNLVVGKVPQIPHDQWRWLVSKSKHITIGTGSN